MSDDRWDPWNLATMGLAFVMVAALITGLVVANWTGPVPMVMLPAAVPETTPAPSNLLSPGAVPVTARERVAPSPAIDEVCDEYTAKEVGQLDEAKEIPYRAAYTICVRARGY